MRSLVLALLAACSTDGTLFRATGDVHDLLLEADAVLTGPDHIGSAIVTLGDIDGDGRDDLAIPNRSNGTDEIWIRYGASLASGVTELVPDAVLKGSDQGSTCLRESACTMFVVPCGDLDGDGLADFVVTTPDENGAVYVFYGKRERLASGALPGAADATLLALAPMPAQWVHWGGWYSALRPLAPGDLDGDGRDDLVLADVIENDGQVALVSELVYGARWSGEQRRAASATLRPVALGGYARALGDFDGDGLADLAFSELSWGAACSVGTTRVLWGSRSRPTGELHWGDQALLFAGYADTILPLGDLDGDGADDIMVHDERGMNQIGYGGARPTTTAVADLPGARLVEDFLASPMGCVDLYPTSIGVWHDRVVMRGTQWGWKVFAVPAAAGRLEGAVSLDDGLAYVTPPRRDDPPTDDAWPEWVQDVVIADQDGDGLAELYVATWPQEGHGRIYVVE